MKAIPFKLISGVLAGFIAGIAAATLTPAFAIPDTAKESLSKKPFDVTILEVKKQLNEGGSLSEEFVGSYTRTVTMSDGKPRRIELTPMMHNGMQVIRLKDNQGLTYMSLNGTTLNGNLFVYVQDSAAADARLKAEGWKAR
jgi:hypothetical protein